MDFEMMCEMLARKIFQCGRFDDPVGRLANTDSWSGLYNDEFSRRHQCKAWAVISRLQSQYLDSISGREQLFEDSEHIEEQILSATTNQEIINAMVAINQIVETFNLTEFPHIDYSQTNEI
jgi:hypothetical protein